MAKTSAEQMRTVQVQQNNVTIFPEAQLRALIMSNRANSQIAALANSFGGLTLQQPSAQNTQPNQQFVQRR